MDRQFIDGVAMHAAHPESFWVPSDAAKASLRCGDHIKLGFKLLPAEGRGRFAGPDSCERMWVELTCLDPLRGKLANEPVFVTMACGDEVTGFGAEHIINILE